MALIFVDEKTESPSTRAGTLQLTVGNGVRLDKVGG